MNYRVTLERKRSENLVQNMRQRVEYVTAANEAEAKRIAAQRCREFVVLSVRRA